MNRGPQFGFGLYGISIKDNCHVWNNKKDFSCTSENCTSDYRETYKWKDHNLSGNYTNLQKGCRINFFS